MIDWLVDSWLIDRLIDWWIYWLIDWLTDSMIGLLTDQWLVNWWINWFITWLLDWLLIDCLINWLIVQEAALDSNDDSDDDQPLLKHRLGNIKVQNTQIFYSKWKLSKEEFLPKQHQQKNKGTFNFTTPSWGPCCSFNNIS